MKEQDWNQVSASFTSLCETIAALRHPKTGCPWDLEQTHATLRKYMLEEAYEAVDVMEPLKPESLKDELGDVLLQVMLNAQIASDAQTFTIKNVIEGLDAKMRRRHPHVFGNDEERKLRATSQIKDTWVKIKQSEKSLAEPTSTIGLFSSYKSAAVSPALQGAVTIGKIARKINFDWQETGLVLEQVRSELHELAAEINSSEVGSKQRAYEEMGDLLFSVAQLCRHLDIDPEVCALDGNKKFLGRFQRLERLACETGVDPTDASTEALERLWQLAKAEEKKLKMTPEAQS